MDEFLDPDRLNPAQRAARRIGLRLSKYLAPVLLLLIVTVIVIASCSAYVAPWEVGIKQIKFGGKKGLDPRVYEGGKLYLLMPFRDKMLTFPANFQILNMMESRSPWSEKRPGGAKDTGVEVPTTDGSKVTSDIVVVWRLFQEAKEGEHGGPLEMLKMAGQDRGARDQRIRERAEDRCKQALGSLHTYDYYNSNLREEKAQYARTLLNDGAGEDSGWHEYGVNIEAVLIRAYYFTEVIDHEIFQKNIQVQERQLRAAEEKKAILTAEVARVEAEGDAAVRTKKIEGESRVKVILAEADLYERTQVSQGKLAVAEAEAHVKKIKAEALQEGGSLYIAQELAPLTQRLRGGIVSGINPFDLDQWIDLLSGSPDTGEEAAK